MEKEVIITGFSNPTSEGVVLHLNKKGTLKGGSLAASEFWVSWDKIGVAIFDNYTEIESVSGRDELRNDQS